MPSKSKKQHNFMEAIAHSEKFAKKVGVPMSVGKDFAAADKGKKFGVGGDVNYTYGGKGQINKQRTRGGSIDGYQKNVPNMNLDKYIGKATGGSVKAFRKGGTTSSSVAAINQQQTHHGSMQLPNVSLNKFVHKKEGGMATESKKEMREEMKADASQDKKLIKKAFGMHDKQEHKGGKGTNLSALKKGGKACMASGGMARMESKGEHSVQKKAKQGAEMVKMAKGGLAGGHKSADGIAQRGKTRAMMPAMKRGGKC